MTPRKYIDCVNEDASSAAMGNLVFALHRNFHRAPFAVQFPGLIGTCGRPGAVGVGKVVRLFVESTDGMDALLLDPLVRRVLRDRFSQHPIRSLVSSRITGYSKTWRRRDPTAAQRLARKAAKPHPQGMGEHILARLQKGESLLQIEAGLKRREMIAYLPVRSSSGHTIALGIGTTVWDAPQPPEIGGHFNSYGLTGPTAPDGWLPIIPL
ncbi:type I-F CRISPR-associated endoribonuclease Cas6/Csy4 [Thiomonas sp.]